MNQLKAGAVLNYAVIILNILVGLLYTPYLLRSLGQSEYGLYSLVASVISCLSVLDLGLGNAVVRYTARYRAEGRNEEQEGLLGMFLMLYMGVGVLAMVAGGVFIAHFGQWFGESMTAPEVYRAKVMLLLLTLNVAFTFPMSIFGSVLTAYECFVFPRILQIVRIILNTLVMVALLAMGYKALALVVVQTVCNVLTLIVHAVYCHRHFKVKIRLRAFPQGMLKEVSVYSFWVFLSVLTDRVYWSTGQFVLALYNGTDAVAVFAVAIQLSLLFMTFSTAISGVFLPRVTGMVACRASEADISRLFIRTGRIQYLVLALILSGFAVFGRSFVRLWAGQGYGEAYVIAMLFFVSLTVPMIQNLGITILQARNRMKFRSLLYLLIASVSLFFQFVWARSYGALGVALAVCIALLAGQGVVMNLYYQRCQKLDMRAFWREIGRMSVVPLLLGISAHLLLLRVSLDTWIDLCVAIAVYVAVYVPMCYRWVMNDEERKKIKTTLC